MISPFTAVNKERENNFKRWHEIIKTPKFLSQSVRNRVPLRQLENVIISFLRICSLGCNVNLRKHFQSGGNLYLFIFSLHSVLPKQGNISQINDISMSSRPTSKFKTFSSHHHNLCVWLSNVSLVLFWRVSHTRCPFLELTRKKLVR